MPVDVENVGSDELRVQYIPRVVGKSGCDSKSHVCSTYRESWVSLGVTRRVTCAVHTESRG